MNKKTALIGYTGFVGSNLKDQFDFTHLYNSKNIEEIVNEDYDLVVCAGIRAQKWYANQYPEEDLKSIDDLFNVLKNVKTRYFVLISTIDVFPDCDEVDESTFFDVSNHHAYGKNRKYAEELAIKYFEKVSILRLPALFGKGLKKNFIYDLMNPVPASLNTPLYQKLQSQISVEDFQEIIKSYEFVNGSYKLKENQSELLLTVLKNNNCTSLMFTDQDDCFQYYGLNRLFSDIEVAIKNEIQVLNLATEPVFAYEIYEKINKVQFNNRLERKPQFYNMWTKYANLFNKDSHYLINKDEVLNSIEIFINGEQK